jgi:hypothetical protein
MSEKTSRRAELEETLGLLRVQRAHLLRYRNSAPPRLDHQDAMLKAASRLDEALILCARLAIKELSESGVAARETIELFEKSLTKLNIREEKEC